MFDGSYSDWNQKRLKAIIDHYGHQFFMHKKILDLGCGYGDLGGVLHRLGGDVTAVDAQQDHLKMISKKYAGVKTVKFDLDSAWPFYGKKFDLTLDLGLLCHLNGFYEHLKVVCATTSYLILETAVLDSNEPTCIIVPDQKTYEGSFNGYSCRASAAAIEKALKEHGFSFKRADNTKLNSGPYTYDWQSKNDGSYDIKKRRLWFCVREHGFAPPSSPTPPAHLTPAPYTGPAPARLTDSKVPVSQQKIISSKSPTPPQYAIPRQPTSAALIKQAPQSIYRPAGQKIRLFYNYYEDRHSARKSEIDLCLQKNLDNALFDLIIVDSDDNPTFNFMFEKINRLAGEHDVSIICNSDIFFDNTISLVKRLKPKEVYALTRWEFIRAGVSHLSPDTHNQDTWIVRGKVENVKGDFQLGKPGCEGRIAYEFEAAGYKVINPSKSLKTYHVHGSGVRNYTESDRIGPINQYLYVDPTDLF